MCHPTCATTTDHGSCMPVVAASSLIVVAVAGLCSARFGQRRDAVDCLLTCSCAVLPLPAFPPHSTADGQGQTAGGQGQTAGGQGQTAGGQGQTAGGQSGE